MEDAKIVQLYWDRNEQAIHATADKYGASLPEKYADRFR